VPWQWIINNLGASGISGVFILALLMGIVAVWMAHRAGVKEIKTLNDARAKEREVMAQMIASSSEAVKATAAATEKRNEVMMAMATTLAALTAAIDKYEDRVGLQTKLLTEKIANSDHVLDAIVESNRATNGILSDLRDQTKDIVSKVGNLHVAISAELRILASRVGGADKE
jgi:hypothetical protein